MSPPYHIIVCANEESLRNLIQRIVSLTYASAVITTVPNGQDALVAYTQTGAYLIVTDNEMPIMNGLALIQSLRSRQIDTPIIAMSSTFESARVLLAAGATRFVMKPFTMRELIQALTALLPP
jgi:CheY-like chemotaxis protein